MSKILIIAEHDGGVLNQSTGKCVACAAQIENAEIDVVLFSTGNAELAAEAAKLDSVNRVLVVEQTGDEHPFAASLAPRIVELAKDYSHVFGPSTTFGKDLMPRVAALLGVNQVSDIMSVQGSHAFSRPMYAGSIIVKIETPQDRPVVATVRAASYRAVANDNSASIENISIAAALPQHTRFIETISGCSDRPDLLTASRVVAGGRALGSAENFDLIFKLAETLGAGVGASRAAVDAGFVPNEMQIGQTGKIIAPELYIAIGISGAIQHVTGIKDAGTIVAINKDEDAPIFEIADIGLVGDLFSIIPELTEALS